MLFVSDERGGFNLAAPGFESSLWATLVCPPSIRRTLATFVHDLCSELGIDELHAHDLDDDIRMRIAAFLASQDVIWGATVIDPELFPLTEVAPWRSGLAREMRTVSWSRGYLIGSGAGARDGTAPG